LGPSSFSSELSLVFASASLNGPFSLSAVISTSTGFCRLKQSTPNLLQKYNPTIVPTATSSKNMMKGQAEPCYAAQWLYIEERAIGCSTRNWQMK
jgi:hypothetical protein